MRLTLDPRARALFARLPRTSWYAVSELVLLALLAVQCARLLWAVVTPVAPLGAWAPMQAGGTPVGLGAFDPFFRLAPGSRPAVVTSINLKLYGVRADMVSGRGSAIVALPDGTQQSFAVGEELLPGVRLEAVRRDGVTLLRGGAREQLFLDQSVPAAVATLGAPPPMASVPFPIAAPIVSRAPIQNMIAASPRIENGAVSGFTLQPNGDGQAFRAAGLEPGDVLLSVDGRPPSDVGSLPALLGGGSATLEIERAGKRTRVVVGAPR